jgi:hypothetical protein
MPNLLALLPYYGAFLSGLASFFCYYYQTAARSVVILSIARPRRWNLRNLL